MTDGEHGHRDGSALSRQDALTRLAVLGAGTLLASAGSAREAAAQPARKLIDVHHHVAPDSWLANGGTPDEARVFKGWSIPRTLEDMDRSGVATAYASITVPGHRFDAPGAPQRISRECNDYMAGLRTQHPGRFGIFAMMPMPDVAATIAEIGYAYDTLKAEGIGLFTSYGDKYIGNAAFDPVFAELNRRNAVVFIHPTVAPCCGALQPLLPAASIEYGTDTTRAIAEYVFSGSSQRFPNVRMIWSHAGGTMPFLVQRFINGGNENLKAKVPNGFLPEAQKFFYDTAQVPSKGAMQALRAIVPNSQILYGTDFPYREFTWTTDMLAQDAVFNAQEMRGILSDNATTMFAKAKKA
jgi:6-methylsalicylate decarboxylase